MKKTYLIRTLAFMKPYNRSKFSIDKNIVPVMELTAKNVPSVLLEYEKAINEVEGIRLTAGGMDNCKDWIIINENGTKIKIGYIVEAKAEFYIEVVNTWVEQRIELAVKIDEIKNPFM